MNYDPTADLIGLIRRRFWILMLVCAVAGAAAILYTWAFLPREYTASARLLYEPGAGSAAGLPSIARRMGIAAVRARDVGSLLSEILKSRTFALKMIRQYDLVPRLHEKSALRAVPTFRDHLGVEARRGGVLVVTFWLKGTPRGLISTGKDEEMAQLVADVINTMLAELQKYRRESTYEAGKRQRIYIEERLKDTEAKFDQALDQLSTFQQTTGIMEPRVQLQAAYSVLGNLDAALGKARAHAHAAQQATEAAGQTDQRASMVASQTALITEIKGNLVQLHMQLAKAQYVEGKTEAHPEVRRLRAQIEEAQESLARELKLEVEALAVKQMVAEAEAAGLERERRRVYATIEKFPVGSVEYTRLQAEVKLLSGARARLYEEWELAAIREKASYQDFEILDPAVPPPKKSAPSALTNAMVVAFLTGLVMLVVLARKEKRLAPPTTSPGTDGAVQ